MPRLTKSVPKYRHHRATGQAVVTIQGKDCYLGLWRSKASKVEYDRLIGEWLAAGRPSAMSFCQAEMTVGEIIASYWKFAMSYYVKDGKSTTTIANLRPILRQLRERYGDSLACEFGPLSLKAIRSDLVEDGHSRTYVNMNVDRIKRLFKWAVSEQFVAVAVYQALATVSGLRKGRTEARETPPIMPVDVATVDATLPHLPATVRDMVRFQRLTGCRPAEVCCIRPCDIDTSSDVWVYQPQSHKTEHHDRKRLIAIGPKAQEVLRRYLLREKTAFCFSPTEGESKRRATAHERRVAPLSCGNRPGQNCKRKPKRKPGDHYTTDSYRRAIHRACNKAFPPQNQLSADDLKVWQKEHRWSPNQLRHSAGTEIRRRFGLEGAQVVLGHAQADVTQIYAERDLQKAVQIMREVG